MAKLTLIRGIPGSGKTTLANTILLQDKNPCVICEADDFFMFGNSYKFNNTKLGDAHKWCQAKVAFFLFRGNDVIVSNTSINMKDINTYYKIANSYSAEFEIVNCEGGYKNTHKVPEEVIESMTKRFKVITTEDWLLYKKWEEEDKWKKHL